MRRETSRVSFLMCPFCVRELLTSPTTSRIVCCTGRGVGLVCLSAGAYPLSRGRRSRERARFPRVPGRIRSIRRLPTLPGRTPAGA
jgi:hypothetical protein